MQIENQNKTRRNVEKNISKRKNMKNEKEKLKTNLIRKQKKENMN